jgi:hypothetical protein
MGPYEVIEHVVGDMGENMGKAKSVLGTGDSTAVFWGRGQIPFYLRYPLPPVPLYNVLESANAKALDWIYPQLTI